MASPIIANNLGTASVIQSMPQVLPQPVINSVVSATPFYAQNALDPNVYSLLLSVLGQSFQQHSQIVGVPQAYTTFNNAFQTAIQQPQTQFTNIYQQMMPYSCTAYPSNPCQTPISTQVQLLPTVLNQHISAVNNGQLCCGNNMNQILGQQLLTQISTQPSCNCVNTNQACCASLIRMTESPSSNINTQNQILMLLAQILQKMNDRDIFIQNQNTNTNINNNNNGNNGNNGGNTQALTGLLSQLMPQTNSHPYLPVVVATRQGSIYDMLLTYLGQQASMINIPNNPYSMLRLWLINHPNQLSPTSLQQILFWILHPQMNGIQTLNVPNPQILPQIFGIGNNINNGAIPNIPNIQTLPQSLGSQPAIPLNINNLLQQIIQSGQVQVGTSPNPNSNPAVPNINLNNVLQQLGQLGQTTSPNPTNNIVVGRPYYVDITKKDNNMLNADIKRIDCNQYEYYQNNAWIEFVMNKRNNSYSHTDEQYNEWIRTGLNEHASIAAFSKFKLQMMSIGAPLFLMELANNAAMDEIRHTRIAFDIANMMRNKQDYCVTFDKFPLHEIHIDGDVNKIAYDTAIGGCFGETISALTMDGGYDNIIDEYIYEISKDEIRHSALAWTTIKWMIDNNNGVSIDVADRKWWDEQIKVQATNVNEKKQEIYNNIIPSIVNRLFSTIEIREFHKTVVQLLQNELNKDIQCNVE